MASIEEIKNALQSINGNRIDNIEFGKKGNLVSFYIGEDSKLRVEEQGLSVRKRSSVIEGNQTYINSLKNSPNLLEIIDNKKKLLKADSKEKQSIENEKNSKYQQNETDLNQIQNISNNKIKSDLVSRLQALGAEDHSQNLANQLVSGKGIEYVGDVVSNEGTNIIIAKDVLELKINSEVKGEYQTSVFQKIFDSQNRNIENPQDVESSLIKLAINENDLQKAIVGSYKEILSEKLTSLKNQPENNNSLRKEAILKIGEDINKFNDKEELLSVLSNLDKQIQDQMGKIQQDKRVEKGRNENKEEDKDIDDLGISTLFENSQLTIEPSQKQKEDNQPRELNDRLSTIEKFRDEDYKGLENRKIIISSLSQKDPSELKEIVESDDVKFKSAIDSELKTYMDAQVKIIKDEIIRSLKLTEVEAGEKASAIVANSGLAVVKELSDKAKSQEDDANFALKAFRIKLEETFGQGHVNFEEGGKDKLIIQMMLDIASPFQGKKKNEIDNDKFNKKLIDIASDPEEMATLFNSAIIKIGSRTSETENDFKKDKNLGYILDDTQKEDLEKRSGQIHESIKKYLDAEDTEKPTAKQDLLALLNPEQKDFPEHPTFKLLADTTRDVLDDAKMQKVKGQYEMLRFLGDEFSNLSSKENKKDAKGYEEVFENISRNCAVLDKKFGQQKDGLTKRLIGGLSKSLEENKESLEDEGSNLKRNCARIFKVAGFATLAAVGGPFGIIAGLLFLYLFRNLGEQKSQEQIERDEEFEKNKQELMLARRIAASRSSEKEKTIFPESEEINKKITEEVEKDLKSTQHKLEENKNTLETQNVKSEESSEKNAKTFEKIKENIKELKEDNKKSSKDDNNIQEKKRKSFVEFALKEEEKGVGKSREI